MGMLPNLQMLLENRRMLEDTREMNPSSQVVKDAIEKYDERIKMELESG